MPSSDCGTIKTGLSQKSSMVWVKGQQLYGRRYVIERKLGQGGFGITYLAKDRKGNPLVIKTLTDEVMTNPDFIEFRDKYQRDFEREAIRLAVCRHPHIVQIENVFHEQSLPCIAMEYIQGEDLWRRVRNRNPLSEAEALGYIKQIGEALTVVHDKGLLHRDVKPENIMVRSGVSEAVLIDFGIAREFIPNLTQTHTVKSTDGFAPIEQYDEQAHRGEYTDVYGLAATLYCLLTTKVPPPAFMRVVRDSLQPPQVMNSKVNSKVNQAILTGMALQPENRPQSVSEWLKLLIPQNPADDFSQSSTLLFTGFGKPLSCKERGFEFPLAGWNEGDWGVRFNVDLSKWREKSESSTDDLSSECGIDYRRLQDLLAAGEWKKADIETADKMLAVIGKKDWWNITTEDIEKFPCTDLRKTEAKSTKSCRFYVDHTWHRPNATIKHS